MGRLPLRDARAGLEAIAPELEQRPDGVAKNAAATLEADARALLAYLER